MTITNLLILGLIVLIPVLLLVFLKKLKIKNVGVFYFLIGLVISGILILIFAWWGDESKLILLKHYGYNIDGMNDIEFYGNVSHENMERVKSLEISISGIGWPLKAIFGFITLIPYFIAVYVGFDIILKKKTINVKKY